MVLAAQAAVNSQAGKWAEHWGRGLGDVTFLEVKGAPTLRPLDGPIVMGAALSFPSGTGLSSDVFSPRAYARLHMSALEFIAVLLNFCELAGDWPRLVMCVIVALIPKGNGDTRPISLYHGLVRL